MKRITASLIYSTLAIMLLANCQNKKTTDGKTEENTHQIGSISEQVKNQVKNQVNNIENKKSVNVDHALSFDSYSFAENLKNDNFFESENTDEIIELKDVGIISYLILDNEVTLNGVFYSRQTNMAIPFNNRPPGGGAFVNQYYNNHEIKYNEEYKRTYSAGLRITLKDPKSVKKLKMYIASESSRVYEYQVDGTGEFRMGFIDLVNIKGIFKGYSTASIYPQKVYEIINAEIN